MRKATKYPRKKFQVEPFFPPCGGKAVTGKELPWGRGIEMAHDGCPTQWRWGLGREMWSTTIVFLVALGCFYLFSSVPSVQAQTIVSQQDRLFQQMLRNPKDLDITFAYVKVATDNGDYEAAIGALERVLFYQPNLARVKYELGSLYFRLGSYEMARRYFRETLACPDIDAVTKSLIEASLPDADKQTQQSRLSGFAQTGLRYQTNASYAPTGGIVRLGGQDLALLPSATRGSDTNWFALAGISHDYDLDNQRGDTLETRFSGYTTEQNRFSNLNVDQFDLSFGPRLALGSDLLPGATIKPYVVGGNTWLGGASYFGSAGAGISASIPVGSRLTLGPEFEWRHVDFNNQDGVPLSSFNTGDWFTTGLALSSPITQQLRLDVKGSYRRGDSQFNFQSYNQWVGEAAMSYSFAPSFGGAPRNWNLSPFVRLIETDFDAPNSAIDPITTQRDTEWIAGVMLEAPLTKTFGLSAIVQYDRTNSTLPNFRQNNFSAIFGPTARF
jgi:hypothetical protein